MTSVKLVWSTPDAEEMIVKMARVSAPKNQDNMKTAPKLLKYLIEHEHWSPFEMAGMTMEIQTTRAIAPQILRHRSFTFQEFSQRYANTNKIGRIEMPNLRAQDPSNRQNSTDDLVQKLSKPKLADLYRKIAIHFEEAEHIYQEMVSLGVAKESARFVLPLATPTRLYMNGTLRSWIHYILLRTKEGSQLEHKQIAEDIREVFHLQFPIISEAIDWNQNA
jgi:thymidylate synthase (FAD)